MSTTVPPHNDLPVIVIGAGPIGLAAAAHLHERGIPVQVLESGVEVADAVRSWGHVTLFSPWDQLIDPAARRRSSTVIRQPPVHCAARVPLHRGVRRRRRGC